MGCLRVVQASGDADPHKPACAFRLDNAVELHNLLFFVDADHWRLVPLRILYLVHVEAAGVPPSAVLPDHAKVLNPGREAGLPVYLTHHDAGLADREGEGRCHLCADGAIGSGMNPLGNLLNDAHAALLICRCL
ncbi:hypothetical protein D3C79_392490 [compost metagenome]